MSTDHSQRGMGAEDYCTCDRPWPCSLTADRPDAPAGAAVTREVLAQIGHDAAVQRHRELTGKDDARPWAVGAEHGRETWRAAAQAIAAALGVTVADTPTEGANHE